MSDLDRELSYAQDDIRELQRDLSSARDDIRALRAEVDSLRSKLEGALEANRLWDGS